MELRQLEAFAEVVRQGGFSAAARALGSTQSSVSKAVAQLEHECGEQLLARLPQGALPTEAGRIVLEHAQAILAAREHLTQGLQALRGLETGVLRIGMPLLGSGPLFAGVFAEFLRRHPRIRIELREEGGQALEAAVQSGEIEIAATLLPAPTGFAFHLVCDDPVMAVLPAQHPLVGRESLRLAELADTPCLLFTGGFAMNTLLQAAYARRGLALNVATRSSQADFMMALASAGLGVAFLPRIMVAQRPDLKIARVDEADFRWRLGLIWRANSSLSPAARRFLELAREAGD